MLDIVLAVDFLNDFERSTRDILGFTYELRNSMILDGDDVIMTYCISDSRYNFQHSNLHDDTGFEIRFSGLIANSYRRFFRLAISVETALVSYQFTRDGTRVPRHEAPDVVIVFSEGYSTVDAPNFVQRIEPRARYVLVLL